MYKINHLIEFLKLDRRYKESKEFEQSQVKVISIATNQSRSIAKNDFTNSKVYIELNGILETFKPTHFYVLLLPSKTVFYIKKNENTSNYLNLENFKNEIIEDDHVLEKIEIEFYDKYFYDKNNREVILCMENIPNVTIFNDKIAFDPESLELKSDTYTYPYSKPISTFDQFINGLLRFFEALVNPFSSFTDKKQEVEISVKKKGTIDLIPTIATIGTEYYLYYYYSSSTKKLFYQISEEDIALKLMFNSQEPFLCFLNETIFSQNDFDYLEKQHEERRASLIADFKRIIIAPLENNLHNKYRYYEAMKTLY